MQDEPLVTIGLPYYNNFNTLELAIKSVVSQSYKNWELIIINDGSSDKSSELVDSLCSGDPRMYHINDNENKGLINRLNQIIDIARGEYIARFDADDIMISTRIEKQIKILIQNSDIDVVSSAIYTIDEKNTPLGKRDFYEINKSFNSIIKKKFIIHPTILARTSWFKKFRYNLFYRAEDLELWIRSFEQTNYFRIQEPLYIYREGNVSIKNYIASSRTYKKIIDIYAPNYLNRLQIMVIHITTNMKNLLYIFMGIFKLQYLLTMKRNKKLSEIEIRILKGFIKKLKI